MVTTADSFTQHRPFLFGLAYRMIGSVMDAEDLVQEAYLRWQSVDVDQVDSPKSYLAAVVTRLAIDYLRSARVRREEYIGPWLPEPLLTAPDPGVDDMVALSESLSMAFLVLLDTLTPTERAVFLLHEVFAYDYREIATIVEKSEANCRQILRRARQKVRAGRPRFSAVPEAQEALVARFLQAVSSGDVEEIMPLLAEDITVWADGGGKVQAARKPVQSSRAVARHVLNITRLLPPEGYIIRYHQVNGEPAIITYIDGRPVSVIVLETDASLIRNIRIVANPDKLKGVPLPT